MKKILFLSTLSVRYLYISGCQVEYRDRSFSTYARKGKGGQAKAYAMCAIGERFDASKYVRKNVAFCTYFLICLYARYFYHTLLSLVLTFITVS